MKKATLLASAVLLSMGAMAQNRTAVSTGRTTFEKGGLLNAGAAAKTAKTTGTDTIVGLLNFPLTYLDSLTLYRADNSPFDSGFVTGMNAYGDRGFAERFDFRTGDTSARVIGVITLFGGTYATSTTKTINLQVWAQGARTVIDPSRPKLLYSGLPSTVLATQNVSIKNLGINIGTGNDSLKRTNFTTPMTALSDTFFVGYDVTYNPLLLSGDTVALYSTRDGDRFSPISYVSGTDTIVNVKNATQYSDNTWHDNFIENFGLAHHLAIFPVVVRQYTANTTPPTAVNPISKKDLSWYGHYPNPTTDILNISLSLQNASDVTLTVLSLEGRVLSNTTHAKMAAGQHVLPLSTSNLPAGTYTYLLRTSSSDGIASQFTVVR